MMFYPINNSSYKMMKYFSKMHNNISNIINVKTNVISVNKHKT